MFSIFKKKDKNKSAGSDRYFKLTVREVRRETADTSTLIFEKPEKPLHYQPGQFLTLILPVEKKEVRRSYSLSSSPFTDAYPAITVKRVEAGKVSNYLNDHMRPGDVFDVMEPAGHFVPALEENDKKRYIMFAAGSGVTPVFSILKAVLTKEPGSTVKFVYQNRNEENIIFNSELQKLEKEYADRLSIIHVLSRPETGWIGKAGRIDAALATQLINELAGSDATDCNYFLCGPAGFMHSVLDAFTALHIPEDKIHKESFYSGEEKPKHEVAVSVVAQAYVVQVQLDGQTYDVEVPPKKTILEAALDQGIDFPFSCQSGLCTACRGKLVAGEVIMEEDEGLTADEKQKGYILNCVSKPKGPGVVVEVG
ncbi:MAG: ferredoxin--NADP reductase [Cyclobacteriaceae bacterium]|nr:ferredoxin--NADP reductase [Cyclobacteriaceae bacterium]